MRFSKWMKNRNNFQINVQYFYIEHLGRIWFIPKKAKKPLDPRKQRKLDEAKSK